MFLIAVLLTSLAVPALATTEFCCSKLRDSDVGDKVFFPSTTEFDGSVGSYWGDQSKISPDCVVIPRSAQDVSIAVKTLVAAHEEEPCLFAIRSGGHTPWAGASSIDDGITIDLSALNQVTYDAQASQASVGSGARWEAVYAALDPLGVAIPGGRAGTVGVGGLTLGGGNSFFAARYGFVCDNVANFEIVLGDGSIVDVNQHSRPDLFKALKGGSNNFGVVTRFDFFAFQQGDLWGGVVVYPENTTAQQLPAFVKFNDKISEDEYASLIQLWQHVSELNETTVVNIYEYTKPVVNAAPFAEYLAIPGNTSDTMRISNLSDLTGELGQAYGFRDAFYTVTSENDIRVLEKAIELFYVSVALAKKEAVGIFRIVTLLQPIPTVFSKHSNERGGNVLGLDRATENLILFQVNLAWEDAADDELFDRIGQSTIDGIDRYARSIKKDNPFIYLNYAYKTQNPLRSYGANNLRKLRHASRKYDPAGVFQTQVPGGFKLAAAGRA